MKNNDFEVKLTNQAKLDIKNIMNFYESIKYNPTARLIILNKLEDAIETLSYFPYLGNSLRDDFLKPKAIEDL